MKKKLSAGTSSKAPVKPKALSARKANSDRTDWPRVGRAKAPRNAAIAGLAAQLKTLREKKRIPLTKLAAALDVAPATLIKFEDKGQSVSLAVIVGIAEHLGCSLEVVVD